MMAPDQARRGQPVLFLGLLLAGWVLIRVVTWQPPWLTIPKLPLTGEMMKLAGEMPEVEIDTGPAADKASAQTAISMVSGARRSEDWSAPYTGPVSLPPSHLVRDFASGRMAAGHNMLWMAGMAALPMPQAVEAAMLRQDLSPSEVTAPHVPAANRDKRWRMDAWLLLREGAAPATATGDRPAAYGASQIGAILAYRLAPGARRDPALYVRASHALVTDGETEVALGARIRPLGDLPLLAHAELRTTRSAQGTELRPATFLAGGVDDRPLPLGLVASGYAQAGVVGGEFATGFIDGAFRVDRTLLKKDTASLDAGLGAWGGAQRDAERLDLGPTARIRLDIGGKPARLAADWRIRVAGNAEPASGAAITLSTGF